MSDGRLIAVPRELYEAEQRRVAAECKEMEDAAGQGGAQLLAVMQRQHAEAAGRMAEIMLRCAYEYGRKVAMEREEAAIRAILGERKP